jgi:hypothetical protein
MEVNKYLWHDLVGGGEGREGGGEERGGGGGEGEGLCHEKMSGTF